MNILIFYLTVLFHLLYDFHWQGSFIADNKGKRVFLLFIHSLTWAMFVGLPLFLLSRSSILLVINILFLFTTHFAIDYWKSHKPRTENNFYLIYIDQALHLLSIIIVNL